MGLETGTYVNDLVVTNPVGGTDSRTQGDDHLRLIKSVLKATFPNLAGAAWRVQQKGTNYTIQASDNMSILDPTASITFSFASVSALGAGFICIIEAANSGPVTLDPNGSETIAGSTTLTIPAGAAAIVYSTGTELHAFLLAPPALLTQIQQQGYQAFTTGGSATAYTLTPTPAITANTTRMRFRVSFHIAPGASPTLAVSGQTAKNLKYVDENGSKQFINSTRVPANWTSDVEYDGTDWVVMNIVGIMTSTVGGLVPTPPNDTTKFLRGDGAFAAPAAGITLATKQATTSGTSIDFTGIPAGTKRITINLNGVSTNGTSQARLQLGDSGGIENTNYFGGGDGINFSAGFDFSGSLAGCTRYGTIWLNLIDASTNTWACTGLIGRSDASTAAYFGGVKATSGTLDRIRLTTVGGADAFDAGEMNISYG